MKLLKTKIALVAAAVTFVSAVSAADVTITPTLEVSNALTLTQVAGTALNFGRIRALPSGVAADCVGIYIPANTQNPATKNIPTTISGGTGFTNPCTVTPATAQVSILSPLSDLTVASFEVADAAPFTSLKITIDHSAPIASPDPTSAVFNVSAVDVYRTATPGAPAIAVPLTLVPATKISSGPISTGSDGSVAFNLGAVITTDVSTTVTSYIDANYTGSINVEVDY